jgi:hypothetical protein
MEVTLTRVETRRYIARMKEQPKSQLDKFKEAARELEPMRMKAVGMSG